MSCILKEVDSNPDAAEVDWSLKNLKAAYEARLKAEERKSLSYGWNKIFDCLFDNKSINWDNVDTFSKWLGQINRLKNNKSTKMILNFNATYKIIQVKNLDVK